MSVHFPALLSNASSSSQASALLSPPVHPLPISRAGRSASFSSSSSCSSHDQVSIPCHRPTPPPPSAAVSSSSRASTPTLVLIYLKIFGTDVTPLTLQLDVNLHQTIGVLKTQLIQQVPQLVLQRLLYAGRLLIDDTRQLHACDIYKESTVQALMRMKTEEELAAERKPQPPIVSPAKRKWNFLRRKVVEQFSPPPKPLLSSDTSHCIASACPPSTTTSSYANSLLSSSLNFGEAIIIELISARNLISRSWNGKSDPYLLCCLQGSTTRSTTKKNTLEPEWQEVLGLWRQLVPTLTPTRSSSSAAASSTFKRNRLHLLLFDHDYLGQDEPLGTLEIDVDSIPLFTHSSIPSWHRLQGVPSGEIQLQLKRARLTSPQMQALFQTWIRLEKPFSAHGILHPDILKLNYTTRSLQSILGEIPFQLPRISHSLCLDEPSRNWWKAMEECIAFLPIVSKKVKQLEFSSEAAAPAPASSPPTTPRVPSMNSFTFEASTTAAAAIPRLGRRNSTNSMLSSPLLHFSTTSFSTAPSSPRVTPLTVFNPALFYLEWIILQSMQQMHQSSTNETMTSMPLSPLFASATNLQQISTILETQKVVLSTGSSSSPGLRLTRFLWLTNLPVHLTSEEFHQLITHRLALPLVVGSRLHVKSYCYSPVAGVAYLVCTNIEHAVLTLLRLRSLVLACSTLPPTSSNPSHINPTPPIFAFGRKLTIQEQSTFIQSASRLSFIHVSQIHHALKSASPRSSITPPTASEQTQTAKLMVLHLSNDGILSGFSNLFEEGDSSNSPPMPEWSLDVSTNKQDRSPILKPQPTIQPLFAGNQMILLRTSPASFELVCNNHSQVFQFQLTAPNGVNLHQFGFGKSYVDSWMKEIKSWRTSKPVGGGDNTVSVPNEPASDLIEVIEQPFRLHCTSCRLDLEPHFFYQLDANENEQFSTCRECLRHQALVSSSNSKTNCIFSTLDLSDLLTPAEYSTYLNASTENLLSPPNFSIDPNLTSTVPPYTKCPSCAANITIDTSASSVPTLESFLADEIQLTWWKKQVGVDGRSPTPESYLHFIQNRILCRNRSASASSSSIGGGGGCSTNFCRLCLISPYHLGLDCADYAEFASSPKCRFCKTSAVTQRNHLVGPPSPALEQVCGQNEECEMKSRMSCLKTHGHPDSASTSSMMTSSTSACQHVCGGIRNEAVCLPCLDPICVASNPDPTGGVDGDSECAICFTESLGAAPVAMLQCGHLLHYRCLLQRLASNWNGDIHNPLNAILLASPEGQFLSSDSIVSSNPRIHFSCISCPLCSRRMNHPALNTFIAPYLDFERLVHTRAQEMFVQEGLKRHEKYERFAREYSKQQQSARPAISVEVAFSLEVLNFYQCFQCKKPYFGGAQECGPGADGENQDGAAAANILPSDLLCSSCKVQSSFDRCEIHGPDWVMYKCRFCCSLSTYHCWDSTHFCDVCHHQDLWPELCGYATGKNTKPIYEYPQCPGLASKIAAVLKDKKLRTVEARESAIRDLYSDPDTCPLGVRHSPNGMEFGMGCAMCRDEKTKVENAKKNEELARLERERWTKLRTRLAKLIPNEHTGESGSSIHTKMEALWLLPVELIDQYVTPKPETPLIISLPPSPANVYDASKDEDQVQPIFLSSPADSPIPSPSPSPNQSPCASPRSAGGVRMMRLPTNRESYAAVQEWNEEEWMNNLQQQQPHTPVEETPQVKLAGILEKYRRRSRSNSFTSKESKLIDVVDDDSNKENMIVNAIPTIQRSLSTPDTVVKPLLSSDLNLQPLPEDKTPECDALRDAVMEPNPRGRKAKFLQRAQSVVINTHLAKPPTHPQTFRMKSHPVAPIVIQSSSASLAGDATGRAVFVPPFSHLPVTTIQTLGLIHYLATDNLTHPYLNPCNPTAAPIGDNSPTSYLCDLSFSSIEEGQSNAWSVLNDPNAPKSSIQTRDLPLSSVQIQFHHLALQATHYAIYVPTGKPTRTMTESQKEASVYRATRAAAAAVPSGKSSKKIHVPPPPIGDFNCYIMSWRLEASNSGVYWEVLDERNECDLLAPTVDASDATMTSTASSSSSSSIFSWRSKKSKSSSDLSQPTHRRVIFSIPNSPLSMASTATSSSSSNSNSSMGRYTMFRLVQTDVNSLGYHSLPFHGFDFFGRCLPAITDQHFLHHQEDQQLTALRHRLRLAGGCFTIPGDGVTLTQGLEVPLSESGLIVQNFGSARWRAIRVEYPMQLSLKQSTFQFSFLFLHDPPTSNSWHFNCGIVNSQFDLKSRCWIGAQANSFGYIAGTGGICNDSGLSKDYGSPYGGGDLITVSIDFLHGTIEFFKNGVSQGIAFRNLDPTQAPFYPAVSLHAVRAQVKFIPNPPANRRQFV